MQNTEQLPTTLDRWSTLPNIKRVSLHEWHAAQCPECGMRSSTDGDRLMIRDDPPRAWCRNCRALFWPDQDELDEEEIKARREIYMWEMEIADAALAKDIAKRRTQLQSSGTWLNMHDTAVTNQEAMLIWKWALFGDRDMDPMPIVSRYSLGWLDQYMSTTVKSPALSIPFWGPRNTLLTIQYRLLEHDGDKYRFQAGLPSTMFLTRPDDFGESESAIVVEGAKKAMVVALFMPEWDVIGMPSKTMPLKLLKALSGFNSAYFALDPDAHVSELGKESAVERAVRESMAKKNFIVDVPAKPDDFFTMYGGTKRDMEEIIKNARRIGR